jgi:hypothetical protein
MTVDVDLVKWAREHGDDTSDSAIDSISGYVRSVFEANASLYNAGATVTIDNVFP